MPCGGCAGAGVEPGLARQAELGAAAWDPLPAAMATATWGRYKDEGHILGLGQFAECTPGDPRRAPGRTARARVVGLFCSEWMVGLSAEQHRAGDALGEDGRTRGGGDGDAGR